jgi:hypothetical protein
VQKTRYSQDKAHILTDDSVHANDKDIQTISGVGILTNNQVSHCITHEQLPLMSHL